MGKFFGTDGIRGKAEMFSREFLEKIIKGLEVKGKKVLVGGDTRESTEEILKNLTELLSENGAEKVGELGVFPTPGINFVMKTLGYDFAIDVTASHNPYTDNGIKIFEFDGKNAQKLGAEGRERIERALAGDSLLFQGSSETDLTTVVVDEKARGREVYEKHFRDYLEKARFDGIKILIDCANGATGVISGEVFEELGASVEVINNDTTFGRKINDGVGSTHVEGVQERMRGGEFTLGAAFDGDGDRCMLVDENGEIVDGDQILVILAEYLKLDKIAGTVMANQGLLNYGKEKGVLVVTTDVGDQNVAAAMKEQNIKIGGEQSGHIILPGEDMGDGILTALMVTKVVAETKKPLSELASRMRKFPQVTTNVPANSKQKEILKTSETVKRVIKEFERKLEEVSGRLLVRPSGTEELVRVTLWGENQEKINKLGKELAEKLTEEFINGRS